MKLKFDFISFVVQTHCCSNLSSDTADILMVVTYVVLEGDMHMASFVTCQMVTVNF